MPHATRTFRLFVSSTFSDLQAERSALQAQVFPRLRELAAAHGCRFQAIDLRWGVSEEAGLDQQTMPICLGEIERCQSISPRPNFLVLLGERFGWRPLPDSIPADEFMRLLPRLTEEEWALACWREDAAENEWGWYRRDDNAVPPKFVLQPRPKGSRWADYAAWSSQVERPLAAALERAALAAGLQGEALAKYTLSATGQEVLRGALNVPDAAEHVFAFFRSLTNPADAGPGIVERDPDLRQRQDQLKAQLRARLPGNVTEVSARWEDGAVTQEHIGRLPDTLEACLALTQSGAAPRALCEAVWVRLSRVMLAEIERLETVDPLEVEIVAHDRFQAERGRSFTGREALLGEITDYLAGDRLVPLVVWGSPGVGKSALLAEAAWRARASNPAALLLTRFIGATPRSLDGSSLLADLCKQIARASGADPASIPGRYAELVSQLPAWLSRASAEKPLVLFVDALDQLPEPDPARGLSWLPAHLPPHVRVVVSTAPGACLDLLRQRTEPNAPVMLEASSMDRASGEKLLDVWLAQAGRTLNGPQKQAVLRQFERCGLPLYLKLVAQAAARWKSYDTVPGLEEDIQAQFGQLLERLESPENHGALLVSRVLSLLAVSRNGLSEDELLDLLWQDEAVRADFFARSPKSPREVHALPVAVWARLFADLEPYLELRSADGADLLNFFHAELRRAVEARYEVRGRPGFERRNQLAGYFERQPWGYFSDGRQMPNARKIAELAEARFRNGQWQWGVEVLCAPDYFIGYHLLHGDDNQELMRYWAEAKRQASSGFDLPGMEVSLPVGDLYRQAWQAAIDQPEYAAAAGALGAFLMEYGDLEGAAFFTRAEEKASGEDPIWRAANLNDQGLNAFRNGDLAGAARHYQAALALLEEAGSPEAAAACVNLADVYLEQGRLAEAQPLLERALELRWEACGERSPETATVWQALGNLALRQENYPEALSAHSQALEIRRDCLGNEHVDVGRSCYNVAAAQFNLGQHCRARVNMRAALRILAAAWPEGDARLAPVKQLIEQSDRLARLPGSRPDGIGLVLPVLSANISADRLAEKIVAIIDDGMAHGRGISILVLLPPGCERISAVLERIPAQYNLPDDWVRCLSLPLVQMDPRAIMEAANQVPRFTQWLNEEQVATLAVMPAGFPANAVDWPIIQHVPASGKALTAELVPMHPYGGPLLGMATVNDQRKVAFLQTRGYRRPGGYPPQPADKLGNGIFYVNVAALAELLQPAKTSGGLFGLLGKPKVNINPLERELREAALKWIVAAGSQGTNLRDAYEDFFCKLVDLLGVGLVQMKADRIDTQYEV